MSRSSPYTRILNSLIPRSKSDCSHNSLASIADKRPRRCSDWSETVSIIQQREENEGANVVLRPLQLNQENIQSNSLYQRRLSKGITPSKSSSNFASEQSSKEVSRSSSMRSSSVKATRRNHDSKRRYRGSSIPSDVGSTCTGVKVQERTVSNRSLPLPGDEYTRLRNFSTTSKGGKVINRGDSFRSKLSSRMSSMLTTHGEAKTMNPYRTVGEPPTDQQEVNTKAPVYKVLIIGAADVGKTCLKNQFMTSEYISAYDSSHEEDGDKAVTIVLNCEESQLEFEEETLLDGNVCTSAQPDAFVVVYSVTNRRSYLRAKQLLYQMPFHEEDALPVVILVGNKNDLARLRTVTTEEGRSLARERACKFIETSVAINHQVDELLVGILTQIRMKSKLAEKKSKRRDSQSKKSVLSTGCKASGMLKKILQRACLKSRSCDNLHVL